MIDVKATLNDAQERMEMAAMYLPKNFHTFGQAVPTPQSLMECGSIPMEVRCH